MTREREALKAILNYLEGLQPETYDEALADLTIVKMIAAEALDRPDHQGLVYAQPARTPNLKTLHT